MNTLETFQSLSERLLKHLPRPVEGSPVQLTSDRLQVVSPGVSVRDLSKMISDLVGQPDFLPADLPVGDILLATLDLRKMPATGVIELAFSIGWAANLSINKAFPVRLAEVMFTWVEGQLHATGHVKLEIDDVEIVATLELPGQVVSATLEPNAQTKALMENRGLTQPGKTLQLRTATILASIPFRQLDIHVELENLFSVGPVTVTEATADVSLSGSSDGSSFGASGEVSIAIENHDPVVVGVAGEVDSHGWRLSGHAETDHHVFTIGNLAASIAKDLSQTAPDLPPLISTLGLSHISAAVDTHDDSFQFDCTLDWDHDAELVVHLEKHGKDLLVSGSLILGDLTFKVTFEKGSGKVLVGSYEAAGHAVLQIDDLLKAMSSDGRTAFGPGGTGIDIGVKAASIALDDDARILLAAQVDAGIDLSRLGDLPLVGSLLKTDEPLGLSISPFYMAKSFAAVDDVKPLLPKGLTVPKTFTEGAQFAASLHLGGNPISLDAIALGDTPSKARQPDLPDDGKPSAAAAPMPAAGDVTWVDVNRSMGPLHIGRAGYGLDLANGPQVDLELEASLSIAGLTLSVDGFGARYNFETQDLDPRLQGLGIDLKRGPLEIGGAFLNLDGDFAGKIIVGTPQFSLNALGAFKMIDGTPSMFVYGVLDMPLGGPAFFFVEGLAAGFGVHRKIKMPEIEAVHQFPLIESAVASSLGTPGDADPGAQLARLHDYVTPKLGEYFVAAGVKFNSFKLLDGFVVLVVSLGHDFEVDVIGTASFATPPELPANVPALAKIELDLMARFIASEGALKVDARLNPKSYVYGPLCHLSGGFAFYAWMKGARAGDFVLSVGGYHPDFKIPDHYPRVPRLELKYQVTPDVYLKGDAYFALTPSILMAGGGLHAQANVGSLKAWADLSVDFLVGWEPFHYDARLHIGIGAQWKCFHTSASADLHIWGPKFSGTASVDWAVFSFDVEFGPKTPNYPIPISAQKFKQSFLQIDKTVASQKAALGIVPSSGVIGDINNSPIVTPADLAFNLSTRVPMSEAWMGQSDVGVESEELGVAPCGFADLGQSKVTVSVTQMDGDLDVTSKFKASPLHSGVPAALWGKSVKVDKNASMIDGIAGLSVTPAKPVKPGQPREKSVGELQVQHAMSVHAFPLMGFAHMGPPPTTLPTADLEALGLVTTELTYVAPVPGLAETLETA